MTEASETAGTDVPQIRIFDTTLRDGEQSPGASLNTHEKLEVARQLARLRVDIIEAGFPISSPDDFEAVKTVAGEIEDCTVAGLVRCLEKDIQRAAEAVRDARSPRIHVFCATSEIHRKHKFKRAKEEAGHFTREKSPKMPKDLAHQNIESTIFDLISAFSDVLSRLKEEEDLREIFEETYTVTDKIKVILDAFQDVEELHFSDLFNGMKSRTEMVVTFLATLELIRLKKISARQSQPFADVLIVKTFV